MQLQGWHDAWWNGVTTLQLAKCIEHIIVSQPSLAGLYHLAADPINKYDLVRSIVEIYGLTKSVESTNAPKYINKVLVDTRKELKLNIPSHRDMLQQLLEFNK
jgi:dTDP-4-dehydrorhamnose reductase